MAGSIYRPRRSVLYTPGTRTDRVEKALLAEDGADVVVADLEDAVGPEDKGAARQGVSTVLAKVGAQEARAERAVRVNPATSDWHTADLTTVIKSAPDSIVLPKVQAPGEVQALCEQLDWLEEAEALAPGSVEVIAQLETATGIARAVEIAQTIADLDRVTALVFGAEDYAASIGAQRTSSSQEVSYARQRVVLAAAIAGCQPIDQVFLDYQDLQGLRAEAEHGRDLGYVGKQIIHPAQIPPVHGVFTPSEREIEQARDLLAAVEEAGIGQGGVIGYEGRMVDRPVIEQARRVVALADTLDA